MADDRDKDNDRLHRGKHPGETALSAEIIKLIPKKRKQQGIARPLSTHIANANKLEPREAKRAKVRGQGISGERRCTAKQEAFAIAVANGSTLTDAYRQAFDVGVNTKPSTVWKRACDEADKGHVADRINQEVERLEREKPHDNAATRRVIREILFSIAQSKTEKTADRIRAAQLVGQIDGIHLFTAPKEAADKDSEAKTAKSLKELENKLVELLSPPAPKRTA